MAKDAKPLSNDSDPTIVKMVDPSGNIVDVPTRHDPVPPAGQPPQSVAKKLKTGWRVATVGDLEDAAAREKARQEREAAEKAAR